MKNKQIGKYYSRGSCRFCEGENLLEILDFGNVPLAGAFIEQTDIAHEKYYPLEIYYCQDCFLVQVGNVISVDILFREKYFFFSSAIGTLVEHFKDFAKEICIEYLNEKEEPTVLEIGCNDGVLIKPLSSMEIFSIGVDPATNVLKNLNSKNIKIYNDCFTENIAQDVKKNYGGVDAVLSCYSFAHIDDMVEVMNGIDCILKDDGVFIFELYYLGTLIEEMQYDNFYHEHMSYYSIKTLVLFFKRYNMEIFDIKFFPKVRTGSTRFYVKYIKNKNEEISNTFKEMILYEDKKGFNNLSTLMGYADKVKNTKKELMLTLNKIKSEEKTIIGYGASGRGTTIMNYCGIDGKYLDYVVDDAPAKQGYYTPGTNLPIKSWDFIKADGFPDYIVLFAWAFTEEVLNKRRDYLKQGGKFIIPLPNVKIIAD
jgi:SAM-dependent methyltransferase